MVVWFYDEMFNWYDGGCNFYVVELVLVVFVQQGEVCGYYGCFVEWLGV